LQASSEYSRFVPLCAENISSITFFLFFFFSFLLLLLKARNEEAVASLLMEKRTQAERAAQTMLEAAHKGLPLLDNELSQLQKRAEEEAKKLWALERKFSSFPAFEAQEKELESRLAELRSDIDRENTNALTKKVGGGFKKINNNK
jgi:hypothetical protein